MNKSNYSDLTFCVADVCFRLVFRDVADARPYLPSYAPFHIVRKADSDSESLQPQSAPVMQMTVGDGLVPFEGEGEELGQFDCGDINHGVYRLPQGGYLILISNLAGFPACAVRCSADFAQCEATLFGDEDNRRFGLNNAIMIAYAFASAPSGIVLMHASVTMQGGHGYLFLGKSGTGKSTHSSLWLRHIAGSDLLNDDNPAVRAFPDGNVRVYGTPWSGKTPCYRNLSVPVGAFLRLEQWPENIIARDSRLKAFASVLSSCSTMLWDKPSYDAIIRNVSAIAAATPAYYLKCRPDEAAAQLSYKTIAVSATAQ